jgi:hypothetical protein
VARPSQLNWVLCGHEVIVRATFRTGPVGTGVYLLGYEGSRRDPHDVEVWLLLLFFPLVPLSRWRVAAAAVGGASPPDALELTHHSRSRIPLGAALRRIGRAAGATVLTCLPFGFGAWKVGSPWATPVLSALLGSVLGQGFLGKLGLAMEMVVLLAGTAIPILVLMHLDEQTPRVSLRSALWPGTAE